MKEKLVLVDLVDRNFYSKNTFNASSKPRTDVENVFESEGWEKVYLYNFIFGRKQNFLLRLIVKLLNNILLCLQMIKLVRLRNEHVFMQYPFLNSLLFIAVKYLSKHNKVVILFHDVHSLRYGKLFEKEKKLFNFIFKGIVHTKEMKDAIVGLGVKSDFVILNFFDYLSECRNEIQINTNNVEIIFAGNLSKSEFLNSMNELDIPNNLNYLLYGKPEPTCMNDKILYKGTFDSNKIDNVKGNWGLVWDGDSVDNCSGLSGEYLKFNAPFKFSLYLALGIPVIVWSKSAMANYVNAYHLGIVINSLSEIPEKIKCIDDNERELMKRGLEQYSALVRNGGMLRNAISEVLRM